MPPISGRRERDGYYAFQRSPRFPASEYPPHPPPSCLFPGGKGILSGSNRWAGFPGKPHSQIIPAAGIRDGAPFPMLPFDFAHRGNTAFSLGTVILDIPIYLTSPSSTSCSHCLQTDMNSSAEKGLESGLRESPSHPGAW